jgi:hypothetical protein
MPVGFLAHFASEVTVELQLGATELPYPIDERSALAAAVAGKTTSRPLPRQGVGA